MLRHSAPRSTGQRGPHVALACGGTGGHLFPGVAVAEQLLLRDCEVTLLISPKEVDQQAVRNTQGMEIATLPAIGMTRGHLGAFFSGFWKSYRAAGVLFRRQPPQAVLAMGGFTSAPPVLAGKAAGAVTFLHESNVIPGKANRWLAHVVTQAFIGFPTTAGRLHHTNILCTGTPVRPQFERGDASAARVALGAHPTRPLLLVMGGSQGASGVNDLVLRAVPRLLEAAPELQFIHLTGPADREKVQAGYETHRAKAVVRPFLTEMELALNAATVAVSRAGGSSLAELAAMRLPSVLIPYPAAADNHQWHNARVLADSGAARLLEQESATADQLATNVLGLVTNPSARDAMTEALQRWDVPHSAELIAERILAQVEARHPGRWQFTARGEAVRSEPRALSFSHAPSGFQSGQPVA